MDKKKYTVQLQINVKSIDLIDIEVEATSPYEARIQALYRYENEEDCDSNIYASDYYETEINKNLPEWEVEEVKND